MRIYILVLLTLIISLNGCSDDWEDHYESGEQLVEKNLWDELKSSEQYSEFVSYLEAFELDTFINSANTKTVFVVRNDAFNAFLSEDTSRLRSTLEYHIIPGLFMTRSIENSQYRRLKTMAEKFVLIQNVAQEYYFDNNMITYTSSLYRNGKFYEIENIAKPRPSLYEYIQQNNKAIGKYIDSKDSIVLDKEQSKPLGFNEQGQTIYDSVNVVINQFEEEYFPLSKEYRNILATLIIPREDTYLAALDEMAAKLGSTYQDHEDIPEEWENEILIPMLLNKGTYGGLKSPFDFITDKVANVRGDSISVDFNVDPESRVLCSNGLVYEYSSFSVEEELYLEKIIEGESLCERTGVNRFAWIDDRVMIDGEKTFLPKKQEVNEASNDSVLLVDFNQNYQEPYNITIKMQNVFPQRYRLIWRTNYRTTGLYEIYVNEQRVKLGFSAYDQFDTYQLTDGFFSVLGYKLYPDSRGFCNLDGWVENITEYGDVLIRFEYIGPGESTDNGFNLDFIQLVPE